MIHRSRVRRFEVSRLLLLACGLFILASCNRSPLYDEEKVSAEVFEALQENDWSAYEEAVTNRYLLLSRLQSPNRFAGRDSFSSTILAPEEKVRIRNGFDRAVRGGAGAIDFKKETFKGLRFEFDIPDDPLTEFAGTPVLPKAYSFVTDSESSAAKRRPYIVLARVHDFVHALGLILPEEESGDSEEDGEDEQGSEEGREEEPS